MRIGILSFAHLHAEAYIHNLKQVPDVELLGIADENQGRGKYFSDLHGVHQYKSYEELLKEKPDGVIICSENIYHQPLAELAANAGANVMSEKPLALSREDCQSMIDTCEKNAVFLMTAFPMRFSASIMEVKKFLDQDGLGRILAVTGTNQGQVPSHHRAWFVDKKLAGGGAMLDHTVHLADIYRWYLNSEVVEVYAQSNHIIQAGVVDVETGGLIMLSFENGTFATIDCSWSKPKRYSTWGGLAIELVGEKGVVDVDAFKTNLNIHGGAEQHFRLQPVGSDANQDMINEFCAAIREKRQPRVSGQDGMKAFEIAEAAYRSVESGQPVRLK
ncbi:MAG: Gfo/Idh/MocA family oxidoreductase [Anaerolineaceae bacterium]|nr:Gfo/Idh/MocA family oxidoreductase [Anaerolineaceae bacterium]